jgi:hypothetical protein
VTLRVLRGFVVRVIAVQEERFSPDHSEQQDHAARMVHQDAIPSASSATLSAYA